MARKCRRNQSVYETVSKPKERVGIYTRLSVADNGYQHSDSMAHQIELLKRYVASFDELKLVAVYTDNGATGTDFDRKAWKQLLADMRTGRISCTVVKDFSRIGRNYIEVGDYLERIFPRLGIRVIAVNENFDSRQQAFQEKMLMRSFTNMMNEYYAREISAKVIQAKRLKQKKGEFNAGVAPYGYRKSKEIAGKLEMDVEAADVVRKIFAWRIQGKRYVNIARQLNSLLLPSPSLYRYYKGDINKKQGESWTAKQVAKILKEPMYLGHMVQGRTQTSFFINEGKTKYLPRAEWTVVEHTHEPIITQEQYEMVEKLTVQRSSEDVN